MMKAVAVIPSTSAHEMFREFVEADTVNPSGGKELVSVQVNIKVNHIYTYQELQH